MARQKRRGTRTKKTRAQISRLPSAQGKGDGRRRAGKPLFTGSRIARITAGRLRRGTAATVIGESNQDAEESTIPAIVRKA